MRQIANAHTLFNVCSVAALLPFLDPMVRLTEKLIPEERPASARAGRRKAFREGDA